MASQKTITGGTTHADGVVIGSAASEKIGFHGATPIVQQAVAKAAGSEPTAAEFGALIDALVALGLIAEDVG